MIELYIIGLGLTTLGFLNVYKPSKKIGAWGYRSERSIQTNENWQLAQYTCGKGLITTGLFILCLSVVFSVMYFEVHTKSTLAISACIFAIFDTIIQTELALAKQTERS
ncbi:MAG: SdpI family protein [Flavobacteriaceae bacterium]|jgi:hypothetical protein|nr:SdpI family protein [Flavobacteriaceae bacterium]